MMRTSGRWKTYATMLVLLLCIPAVVLGGAVLLREKYAAWVTLCVAVLSCVPLLYSFERRDTSSKELIVLAVLVAISSVGRFVFAWLPGFKPVTAITVIVSRLCGGVYVGGNFRFLFWSRSVDTVSDDGMGLDWFLGWCSGKAVAKKPYRFVPLRRIGRCSVFRHYGCVDSTLGGRHISVEPLSGCVCNGVALYSGICRFQRCISLAFGETNRRQVGTSANQIRYLL